MPAISVFTKGGNLSPILFVIYLNAFLESLGKNYQGLHTLAGDFQNELELFMKLYILLYAEDTIIMAESSDDLQAALNGLYDYYKAWSLSVNISKTKVVIFSNGKVRRFAKFYLGEEVDVVYDYVYLEVTFNYNGPYTKAMEKQINQARKAMLIVLEKAQIWNLPFDMICELYEKCAFPVKIVWFRSMGFQSFKGCRNFPPQLLEIGLETFKLTANCMLYSESGMTDLDTKIKCRMVVFGPSLKIVMVQNFPSCYATSWNH